MKGSKPTLPFFITLRKLCNMNEYTILLIAVAMGSLILMILKRHPAILLTASASGMGGLFAVLSDVDSGEISSPDGGTFLVILMVIVVAWSVLGWFDILKKGESKR